MPEWVSCVTFTQSGFESPAGDYWRAETLYEAAERQGCKPYRLPLKYVDLTQEMFNWGRRRIWDMAFAYRRMSEADMDKPILLGPMGNIMDGFHRMARAVGEGRSHVMVIRLKELPPADETRAK